MSNNNESVFLHLEPLFFTKIEDRGLCFCPGMVEDMVLRIVGNSVSSVIVPRFLPKFQDAALNMIYFSYRGHALLSSYNERPVCLW